MPSVVARFAVVTAALLAPAAALGAEACPFATRAEASEALGKPTLAGEAEGRSRCFFAAADTRGALAVDYVEITVTRHDSAEDARLYLRAASGIGRSLALAGLGEQALFRRDVDSASLLVLVGGTTTVLVSVNGSGARQADPEPALRRLADAVLSRL